MNPRPGKSNGKSNNDDFFRLMARYLPLIGLMPASAAGGYFIGYGLDLAFSTMQLRWIFLVVGVVAGIVQVIRTLSQDDA